MLLFKHQKGRNIMAVYLSGNTHLVEAITQGVDAFKSNVQELLCIHYAISVAGSGYKV
jgi:hypothetical protein